MSRRIAGQRFAADERSASEVVAFVLVTAIVIVTITGIILAAGPQLAQEQENVQVGQAEQGLTQFDDEAFRVAVESAAVRKVDIGLRGNSGTLDVEPESGHILIEYKDKLLGTNRTEVLNTSLGTVVYEEDDTTIGYQGGGVWRSDGNGSVMVSPPEISYNGNTLTMPVVTTARAGSVHSDVQIRPNGTSEQKFPEPLASSLQNKVNTGTLQITIESRYYRAWGEYFEDETDATVTYPGGQRVIVIFFGSAFSLNEDAGIIATSGPGEVFISGGSDPAYINSYDSSEGPYSDTKSETGVLKAAGDVTLSGNAAILGDTESEGRIKLKGQGNNDANITGDADATDGVYIGNEEVEPGEADNYDQIGGNVTNDASVPELVPLPVKQQVDEIKSDNDNAEEDGIDEDTNRIIFNASGAQEIGPGTYYLEEIDMDDKNLFLDARNGSITLAVNNYVSLHGGSKIKVKGQPDDSAVQVYIASRGSSGQQISVGTGSTEGDVDNFYVGKNDKITVKGDRSPRFQVIGPADFTGGIDGDNNGDTSEMTGVVFAPTLSPTNETEFTIKNAEFFGAIVTGNLSLNNKAEVHFDRGILDLSVPLPEDALLDFLYVTEHGIKVESS